MQDKLPEPWWHDHVFGLDKRRTGERRTLVVIAVTGGTMVVEIAAGIAFGSMALLADGLHMASHTMALGIAAWAYVYARRHARDPRFSFGTGKVNSLAGFTGAVLLAVFALMMSYESVNRFFHPVAIVFDQAILVAIIGFLVNAFSVVILGGHHHSEQHGDAGHRHDHDHDHNLRSAYLHVLADALTSLLAIGALLGGKYLGFAWMDPVMGLIGAILVSHWSIGLLRSAGRVLLDFEVPSHVSNAISKCIDSHDGNRVTDLHIWTIGPETYAAILTIVTPTPRPPDHYKKLLPADLGLAHVTVEVHKSIPVAQSRIQGNRGCLRSV